MRTLSGHATSDQRSLGKQASERESGGSVSVAEGIRVPKVIAHTIPSHVAWNADDVPPFTGACSRDDRAGLF